MKNFALIGAAGYIAPRHLKAIYETKNNLVAALDKHDNVGVLDSFFPDANFFTETELFDRHLEKIKNLKNGNVDFFSICTPNYLHDSHIRMALRRGADAICEKPLVLNPWNVEALSEMEKNTGNKIWNILQLRLHPSIIKLKEMVDKQDPKKVFDIDLTYITSRGNWYYTSWKGDAAKSGGIATNIGVHFFDMLSWIFGNLKNMKLHLNTHDRASGLLEFERARVRWFLSIDYDTIPNHIKLTGQRTYRSIKIENEELEFSSGFKDLHTRLYEQILNNKGFGLEDTINSIEIVHKIRNCSISPKVGDYHPFAKLSLKSHPFKKLK